jgi:hypothetical protein
LCHNLLLFIVLTDRKGKYKFSFHKIKKGLFFNNPLILSPNLCLVYANAYPYFFTLLQWTNSLAVTSASV